MPPADSQRVDRWKLRTRTLAVGRLPLLMGVINVTPDSFSDGGHFAKPGTVPDRGLSPSKPGTVPERGLSPSGPFSEVLDATSAVEHGLRLAAEGADILDVGGESTRPGAEPLEAEEELRRVLPVVAALCEQTSRPVSIDTSKALVARAALDLGAEIINDVTAFRGDAEMLALAADAGCGVCAMHMQGTPLTMQEAPQYDDVVEEVLDFLRSRRDALIAAGIEQGRIALDPGIGFGKAADHNLVLLRNAWRLHELGCPVLIGHSRKRFIGEVLGRIEADRTAGTIGVALATARQGVQVLRVHDVAAVRQALLLFEAAGGL